MKDDSARTPVLSSSRARLRLWLPVLAALLLSCAGPRVLVLREKGMKFATVEVVNGLVKGEVRGFDREGRVRYVSRFIGGCDHKPGRGHEVPGSKVEYDGNGKIISSWAFSPDSQRAVYTRRMDDGIGRYRLELQVHRQGIIDSIIHVDAAGDTQSISDYQGKGCLELSPYYPGGYFQGFFMLKQGLPYWYDTLTHTTFEKGKVSSRNFHSPDSIIDLAFFPNGNLRRRYECAVGKHGICGVGYTTEYRESGRLYIEQRQISETRKVHRHYYENGNLMTESHYHGTKLDSLYTSWHENGKVHQKILHSMGKELEILEWDEQGKPIPGKRGPPKP